MNKYSHVFGVFVFVALLFLCLQIILVLAQPASFGQHGRYRGDHLMEASSLPSIHKGIDYCLDCHEEEWDMADAKHANLSCEVCHFLPTVHAAPPPPEEADKYEDKDGLGKYLKIANMPVDKTRGPCVRCHIYFPSRPQKFPQVKDMEKHIKDGWKKAMGERDVNAPCARCHNAHFPKAFMKIDI